MNASPVGSSNLLLARGLIHQNFTLPAHTHCFGVNEMRKLCMERAETWRISAAGWQPRNWEAHWMNSLNRAAKFCPAHGKRMVPVKALFSAKRSRLTSHTSIESLHPKDFNKKIFDIEIRLPRLTVACRSSTICTPSISNISEMKGDIEKSADTINLCLWCKFWEKYQNTTFTYFDSSTRDFLNVSTVFQAYHSCVNSWGKLGYIFRICMKMASKWSIDDQKGTTGEGAMACGRYMSKVWPAISPLPVIQFRLAIAHYFAN